MSFFDPNSGAAVAASPDVSRSHYDEVHYRVVTMLSQQIGMGERVPSDRQLAQQFGVSNVTIGRVMHDLKRRGVVQRVPGKGTFFKGEALSAPSPEERQNQALNGGLVRRNVSENKAATAPVEAFSWILTSFRPDDASIPNQRWALRAASSIERAIQRGGRTTLTNTHPQAGAANPIEILENLRARGINQVIVATGNVFADCPELAFQLLDEQARPTESLRVIVHLPLGVASWPFDAVRFDDERGVYGAVAHLWNLGHREIVFAAPQTDDPLIRFWVEKRALAFERALRALSKNTRRGVVLRGELPTSGAGDPWEAAARAVADEFWQQPRFAGVTAAVGVNDPMAQVMVDTARQHGRRVPEDFSVIGFDDEPWSSSRGLTTLHVPVEEMGEQAAQLAMRRLAQPKPDQRIEIVLQPTLVVRETTAKCPEITA